ncbi:MAG: OmpA-OmpF porin, family [Thermoleophilaceae bacterium]|nr:OmpA-OmpF porin, family [Thermoleophilaceae bacterium]
MPAGGDSFQIFGTGASAGPNGGYVPFAYLPGEHTYTIRWSFTYNPGSGNQTITKDIAFTTLAGPDGDGDGVPDASDSCSTVSGTQANGCPPPVQTDPDGDGVFGSADKCPTKNGGAALNGCPPPVPIAFTASLGAIKDNKLARKALVKGVSLPIKCSLASKASAKLKLSRKIAKQLQISVKPGQKTVTIGSGSADCTPGAGRKIKVKLKPSLVQKVRKPKGPIKATLGVLFKRAGSKTITVTRAVKLT